MLVQFSDEHGVVWIEKDKIEAVTEHVCTPPGDPDFCDPENCTYCTDVWMESGDTWEVKEALSEVLHRLGVVVPEVQ